ncbi:outer membrane beta-barrel protein [Gammaproteobacteria bacterium AB-CW1]|uniref:Outer membrane beta-barrel protein n=1 Tax=Natronospira elongata TaxID=3110268 RepID=A0AAP6JE14_9GAMM|nr:outer membrane beta-barrel protein [Gammaproteobacteria bacterium AB-CW1]
MSNHRHRLLLYCLLLVAMPASAQQSPVYDYFKAGFWQQTSTRDAISLDSLGGEDRSGYAFEGMTRLDGPWFMLGGFAQSDGELSSSEGSASLGEIDLDRGYIYLAYRRPLAKGLDLNLLGGYERLETQLRYRQDAADASHEFVSRVDEGAVIGLALRYRPWRELEANFRLGRRQLGGIHDEFTAGAGLAQWLGAGFRLALDVDTAGSATDGRLSIRYDFSGR